MNRIWIAVLSLVLAVTAPVEAGEGSKDIVTTAVEAGEFKTLATALEKAGLVDALKGKGPFTVFAPTDAAFAKLPAGTVETLLKPENKAKLVAVLTYHVVAGDLRAAQVTKRSGAATLNGQRLRFSAEAGKVRVGDATVAKADIACSNGVIHVIDSVVLPEGRDVTAVAEAAGSFRTLLAAVEAAGLLETLRGEGPFTIFAPTDAAFAKLPAGTVEDLLKPENRERLARILQYHVVPGRVYSEDAVAAGKATTLAKLPLRIDVRDGVARVGTAAITGVDIDASNGVIHVIESVLLPAAQQ
ncbi:MAG: fasciclin domain-containing protein [Planctomycetes bacterium]|nr:fasciclin domain-containing protein [Planctomycetota bacterium]